MIHILFVCHGNICRSPMAEFVMKDLVAKEAIAKHFAIASAATSSEELGNPVYPPVHQLLAQKGIDAAGKTAYQLCVSDYEAYDYLVGMDSANFRNMHRLFGDDPEEKITMLLSHAGVHRDIADPWYTRNFEETWHDVNLGCQALLNDIRSAYRVSISIP